MQQILSTCCVLGPVPGIDYGPYSGGTPDLSLILEASHLARTSRALDSDHQPIPLHRWENGGPERKSKLFKNTQGANEFPALKAAEVSQCSTQDTHSLLPAH